MGRSRFVDTASKLQAFREEMKWLDLELDRLRPPPGETLCEECFVLLYSAVFMVLLSLSQPARRGILDENIRVDGGSLPRDKGARCELLVIHGF